MHEIQYDYMNRDKAELTEKKMTRFTPEQRRDIDMTCAMVGLKHAVLDRIFWIKFNDRILRWPKELRRTSMEEIDRVVDDMVVFVPMLKKQVEQNPRGYYANR